MDGLNGESPRCLLVEQQRRFADEEEAVEGKE